MPPPAPPVPVPVLPLAPVLPLDPVTLVEPALPPEPPEPPVAALVVLVVAGDPDPLLLLPQLAAATIASTRSTPSRDFITALSFCFAQSVDITANCAKQAR